MSINVIDLMSRALTPDLSAAIARVAGTADTGVQSVAGSVLPALVAGLAHQAGTTDGASRLFSTLTGMSVDADLPHQMAGALNAGQGSRLIDSGVSLLHTFFGTDRTTALTNALGEHSNLNAATSRSLLALLAPLALGALKKYVLGNRMDATGVANLLRGQGGFLSGLLDGRFASALGLGAPAAFLSSLGQGAARVAAPVRETVAAAAPVAAATSSGIGRWLPWIIGAAVLLFLLSQLGKCGHDAAPTASTAPATTPAPATQPAAPAASVTLPAPAPAAAVEGLPQKVYFETGKADIGDKGKASIDAAVTWMKGDAGRKVQITGYTDKTGDLAANEKLAKDRAVAVRDAITAAGVDVARIEMQKPIFVEANAVAGSDAEARRVEITESK